MQSLNKKKKPFSKQGLKESNKPLNKYLLGFIFCLTSSIANAANDSLQRLKTFSLEDLAAVEVSILGKTAQKIVDVPAAVYLLTAKQISQSGATNIPDLLRLVPGLHVAQLDANKWVVSSRGFSNRVTNKLLVMIDGRSIYNPLFGGVNWDQQNLMFEDIKQVEVIRGPGSSAWGANAVNGVINIVSKHSRDTQGSLISTLIGSEKAIVSLRQGGKLSDRASYRVYAKHRQHDESVFLDGTDATDSWNDVQLGFRMDWQLSNNEQLTLQGDVYEGDLSERLTVPSFATPTFTDIQEDNIEVSGVNVLARWTKSYAKGSSNELQIYFDHEKRDQWVIEETTDIFDVDYKYSTRPMGQHALQLGAGYRYMSDSLPTGDLYSGQVRMFAPNEKTVHLFNAFIQDEITLQEDAWWLTLGTKVEHNQYTGIEFQPSARLHWKPADGHLLWGGLSRSVRTPSRFETDAFVLLDVIAVGPPPVALALQGNRDLDSEILTALEVGYRYHANQQFMIDMALFYQDYDKLMSFDESGLTSAPPPIAALAAVSILGNKMEGASYGIELSTVWSPSPTFNLTANYSYLQVDISPKNLSTDTNSERQEGLSPQHQFNISSNYQLNDDIKLNLIGRYVGELSDSNIDSYTELDSSIQWRLNDTINLALVARNLLHEEHQEAKFTFFPTAETQVEREIFIKVDWLF